MDSASDLQPNLSNLSKVSLRIQARPHLRLRTLGSKPLKSSSHSLLGTHSSSDLSPSLLVSSSSHLISLDSGAPRPGLAQAPTAPILRKTAARESVGKKVNFTVETPKAGIRPAKARAKSKLLMAHHSPL